MRRALAPFALLVAVGSLAVLAGCGRLTGKLTGVLNPNQPPSTVLFVNGPVDTVNHVVRLYWYGTDVDGDVVGYEWRFENPAAPADTAWRFTTSTDSSFTIQTPAGFTDPVFSVRAVDESGLRDPAPPRQRFLIRNLPPTVRLTSRPNPTDTTFASVSVTWSANDPDGDAAGMRFLVWLNGREATPELTSSTSFTMPSDRFAVPTTGPLGTVRKLYVRAIDAGGMAGPLDSCQWVVRRPVTGTRARLLIVDDVPRTVPSNLRFDTLYTNSCQRVGLTADQYTVLRLDTTQPFRSAQDFAQTFKLFEAVVWYRGQEITFSTLLRTGESGISDYLRSGGRFYLDGLYLFEGRNATGPLSEDFVRTHLGSRGLRGAFTSTTTFADTSAGFGNSGTSVFLPSVPVNGAIGRDSLYVRQVFAVRTGEAGGLRRFDFIDRSDVVMWGAPGTLTPASADSTAVGMSVAQAGGGRAVVVCTVPAAATPPVGAGTSAGTAARFITNIYRHLGLDRP